MLTESNQLLTELIARLPELEWKISKLGLSFLSYNLPRNLFRFHREGETTAGACITEIKEDLQTLLQQKSERSAFYLAEQIRRKVNVLVTLCQIHSRKNKKEEKVYFGVKMLSTRQQWIAQLEMDIGTLEKQQQALAKTFEQRIDNNHNSAATLQLKAELGEIERRLTLAQETFNRAVS
ncbi:hypothetical protein [Legionella sp.]|uniref:hypothetical protein n=1 Tax=Legionella sp. TaxID=459 RepID=UPI003CC5B699